MAIIDEIERFEAGAERIRASAPSLTARQRPVAQAGATPGVAQRPTPALGTRVGAGARAAAGAVGGAAADYANRQIGGAEATLNLSTGIGRAGAGLVRDAGREIAGMPASPNAGQPIPGVSLPRLGGRPAPTAPAATAAAPLPANWSSGSRSRPVPQRPAAVAAPAASPPAATSTAFNLQPGDVNTFTGADGVTRAVPGLLNQPAATQGPAEPAPVAARPVAQQAPRGRQGAVIANPNDNLADKLTRALTSSSLKGSPSARAAVAQAILGEAGAVQAERASALATGDRADLAAVDNGMRAANENADRDLSAQQFNAQLVDQRAARTEERLARRPEVTVSSDGTMGIVSGDGRFQAVTDQTGRSVRAPQAPRQTGELTDGDRLKSYTDRYNAIMGDVTTDAAAKQQAVSQLDSDPLYAGLRGGGQATEPPAEAIAQLRANPDARGQFDEVFGSGAAARYLGP